MAEQTTSVNVEALRQAQAKLNESADESLTQYNNADARMQEHVGNAGDGSLGGKLGNMVNSQWSADTVEAVNKYKQQAEHLLNEALSTIGQNAANLSAETESLYRN